MANPFRNIPKQVMLAVALFLFFGGIALAYFTNDTEPWGTIGGFATGISVFVLIAYTQK